MINSLFSILIADEKSIVLPETVKSFEKIDPSFKIWNDEDIKDFIKNNFDDDVLKSYLSLNPYAYKSDLASYCILYKNGGWFSSITNEIIESPVEILNKKMLIFRDIQRNSKTSWAVACQLMYSEPNNPVFYEAIKIIKNNVKNKFYGITPLCITGPSVLGRAVAIVGNTKEYSIGDFVEDDIKKFVDENGKTIANYKKISSGETGISGTNNYNNFWYNKDVYKEIEWQ